MKEKNLSLARKILLALLAALMAVGAFFGVLSMKRNGYANGALTADAAEPAQGTYTDEQQPVADAAKAKYDELKEGASPRSVALLDEALADLYKQIAAASGETVEQIELEIGRTLTLALEKGKAVDMLVDSYKAIVGAELPIPQDGFKLTAGEGAELDAAQTAMQTAIDGILAATNLQADGAEDRNVNDILKSAVAGLLTGKDYSVLNAKDSTDVTTYINGVAEKVNALSSTEKAVDVKTAVAETNEEKQDVATVLQAKRGAEKADAVAQYEKIKKLLNSAVAAPEALQNAVYCADVNEQLVAAVGAVLAVTEIPQNLADHYAAVKAAVEADETAGTVADIYAIVLGQEEERLTDSKTAAGTALAGYCTTIGVDYATKVQEAFKAALAKIVLTEAEGATVYDNMQDALGAVNAEMVKALKGALDGLVDAEKDSAEAVQVITDAKAAIDEIAEKDAMTGLIDATEAIKGVTAELAAQNESELTAAQDDYKAFNKALTGNEDVAASIAGNTLIDINTTLKAAVIALIGAQYTEGEDSQAVDTAVKALKAAAEALTAGNTAMGCTEALQAQVTAVVAQKKAETDAAVGAYKAAYTAITGEAWTEEDTVPAAITGAATLADINTALATEINALFATQYEALGQTLTAAQAAITKVATDANATTETKTYPVAADFTATLTAQKAALDLQKAKNDANAELQGFVDGLQDVIMSDETTAIQTALTNAKAAVNAVTKIEDVATAKASGFTAIISAGAKSVAVYEFKQGYINLYGADDANIDTKVNEFKGTLTSNYGPKVLKALQDLIDEISKNAGSKVAGVAATLNAAMASAKTTAGTKNEQIPAYADALKEGKEMFAFAKAQDDACAAIDAALKAVQDNKNVYDRMTADDKTALTKQATDAKAAINAKEYGKNDDTPATILDAQTAATNKINATALKAAAMQEFINAVGGSAFLYESSLNHYLTDELNKLNDAATTVKAVNEALQTAIEKALEKALENDTTTIQALFNSPKAAIQALTFDSEANIHDFAAMTEAMMGQIADARKADRATAVTIFKAYYKLIMGVDCDDTNAIVKELNNSNGVCVTVNGIIKKGIDALYGIMYDRYLEYSDAVQTIISDRQSSADSAIDNATKASKLPDNPTANTLIAEIEAQFKTEQANAVAALTAFYNALIAETTGTETVKAALDAYTTEAGANALTKTVDFTTLYDGFTAGAKAILEAYAAINTNDKIAAIVTKIEGNITTYLDVTDEPADLSAGMTEFGQEANACIRIERDRAAALAAVEEAYKAVSTEGMSSAGKAEMQTMHDTAIEGLEAVTVTKTTTWAAAYTTAKAKIDAIVNGTLQLDQETNAFEAKQAEAIAVQQHIEKVQAEYVNAYMALTGKTGITTATEEVKAVMDEIAKAADATAANTALKTAMGNLVESLKTKEADAVIDSKNVQDYIDALKTAVDTFIDAAAANVPDLTKGKVTVQGQEAQMTLAEAKAKLDDIKAKEIAAAAAEYLNVYKIFYTDATADTQAVKDFAAKIAGMTTKAANAALKEGANALLNGMIQKGADGAVLDSKQVRTAIETATKADGTIDGVAAGDNGISILTEEVQKVVTAVDAFRKAEVADATAEYNKEYAAIVGSAATEVPETITKAANATAANTALKDEVKKILVKLSTYDAEKDAKEITDYLANAGEGTAQALIDAAAANEQTGISDLAAAVAAIKEAVAGYKAAEKLAAAKEYINVYNRIYGTNYTVSDSGVVAEGEVAAAAITDAQNAVTAIMAASITDAKAANEAMKVEVVKLLKGYIEQTGDSAAAKAIYPKEADYTKTLTEVAANETNGISAVTETVGTIVKALEDRRAAERAQAVEAYLAVYAAVTGTTVTAESDAVKAAVAAINAAANADAANMALSQQINAFLTEMKNGASAEMQDYLGKVGSAITELITEANTAETRKIVDFTTDKLTIDEAEATMDDVAAKIAELKKGANDAAQAQYVAAYTALIGKTMTVAEGKVQVEGLEAAALAILQTAYDKIGGAVNVKGANDALAEGVNAIIDSITFKTDSDDIKDQLGTIKAAVTQAANDATAAGAVADLTGTIKTVKEDLEGARADEIAAVQAQYIYAYNTLTGKTMTVAEGKLQVEGMEEAALATLQTAYDEIGKAADCINANKALAAGVEAIIAGIYSADDSKTVKDYMDAAKAAVKAAIEKQTNVADLATMTADVNDDNKAKTVQDIKAALDGMRADERTKAKTQYTNAYKAINGEEAEVPAEDANIKAIDEAANAKAVNDALKAGIDEVVKSIRDEEKDSALVKSFVGTVLEQVAAAFTAANAEAVYTIPDLTEALKLAGEGEEKIALKAKVDAEREAERKTATDEYKAAYACIKGEELTEEDAVITAINGATYAADMNDALVKGVQDLLAGYIDATNDSADVQAIVKDYQGKFATDAEKGTDGIAELIAAAEDGTYSGLVADAKKAIDEEKVKETKAAIDAYIAAYKTITEIELTIDAEYKTLSGPEGMDAEALQTAQAVIDAINEAENITAANGALKAGVIAILPELSIYDAEKDATEITDYLTTAEAETAQALINGTEAESNGITPVATLAAQIKEAVLKFKADERAAAVAQYLAAYKTTTGKTLTEEDEPIATFKAALEELTYAADINAKLIEETVKLVEGLLSNGTIEGESAAMITLNADSVAAVKGLEVTAANGIAVITDAVSTIFGNINDLRNEEANAAKQAYLGAFIALVGAEATSDEGDVFDTTLQEIQGTHDMSTLNGLLIRLIGDLIDNRVMSAGDSKEIKAYLGTVKSAVEAAINAIDAAVDAEGKTARRFPVFYSADPEVEIDMIEIEGVETALAEIKPYIEDIRTQEREAAEGLFKHYYEIIHGEAYTDRYATDADRAFLEAIAKAGDIAEVNEILKNAVYAYIDAYLTAKDGDAVKAVVADQKAALDELFGAKSEAGDLAEELDSAILKVFTEIDLRRYQDQKIAVLTQMFDAIEQARMESKAKEELAALKAAAIEEINAVALGEGKLSEALAAASATLDKIANAAIGSFDRKQAEGIAKQEYIDSYKALTGAETADEAALAAIAEAAQAKDEYITAVNNALKKAVEAILDTVLVRDEKNVLKDSQATKAIVETAKQTVKALVQTTEMVPDVSEAVKDVKTAVEAQRTAEKTAELAAIDAIVAALKEGKTYSDALNGKITAAADQAKAKVQSGYYADFALYEAQLKAQVALIDALAAFETRAAADKTPTDNVTKAIEGSIEAIGEAATVSAVEEAMDDAILNAEKVYAKDYVKVLVSAESDSIKEILDGPNGFNAKIDGAKTAEDVQAIIAEAKLAIESGRYLDNYAVLRKAFDSLKAEDKAALEAAKAAFPTFPETVRNYLNSTTKYSSYVNEIEDKIVKTQFEAKRAEIIAQIKALAAEQNGSYIQKTVGKQIAAANDVAYEPHTDDSDRAAYLAQQEAELDKVLTASGTVMEQAKVVQSAEDRMSDMLGEYLASGEYQGKAAENLQNIIDKYFGQAEEGAKTEAELQAIYDQAKAEIENANVSMAKSSVALTEEGEYENGYDGTALWGTVTDISENGVGFAKATTVSIEMKDTGKNMDGINAAAQDGKLKAAAGVTLTAEEMKALVDGKDILTTLDITFAAAGEDGLYIVKVLLPEELRGIEGIAVVYENANGEVEVFNAEVSEDGKYLTFTTDHFSEFIVLGEGAVNLWWLVITLTVILGLELVALLVVLLKKNGKKQNGGQAAEGSKGAEKVASVMPLGLLALVVPMNATGICIMLGVFVVAMGVGIFFAVKHKKNSQK